MFNNQDEDGNMLADKTVINDCYKWAFFGSTISKGKNNHVYDKLILTCIKDFYNNQHAMEGKDPKKLQ